MVLFEGFEFELTGFFSADGSTTMTISVSGNGQSATDLKGWVCEICADDAQAFAELGIVSCEKRRRQGAWVPAVAQKTSYELTGDIGINGVIITDWVGRYADDPQVEFRIVLDAELAQRPFKVGLMQPEGALVSGEQIRLAQKPESKVWLTPVEKSFCLFMVVPEGYKPIPANKACVSLTTRMLHIVHGKNEDEAGKPVCARLMGSVRIAASAPLEDRQACGDGVHAATCDCFEVCEIIGCTDEDDSFGMRDITVCPQTGSLDLTLLNMHCGKSVYRLDGKYVIERKGRA